MRGLSRKCVTFALGLGAWHGIGVGQALAQAAAPAGAERESSSAKDEKLPAQLPSVTIQGEDRSSLGGRNQIKLTPTGPAAGATIRLPEPAQRRATSEDNRSLMVNVTPSTVESIAALPGMVLPYTRMVGGYGPLTQYRLGIYDARQWGPALGITELGGRAGWNWSGWHGKEWLDWAGVGRLGLQGDAFSWNLAPHAGNQSFLGADLAYGDSENLLAGVLVQQGQASLGTASVPGPPLPTLSTALVGVNGQIRPAPMGDHQATVRTSGQYRIWGKQAGPEAYAVAIDDWSLSERLLLQASLGGGYWGREPILDPGLALHFRPSPGTHLYTSVRTASELPSFQGLYFQRSATALNDDLQAERIEGWAELGGSQRFTETTWGHMSLGLRRSHRHIFWADPERDGLWAPLNAAGENYSPVGQARAQIQWLPEFEQDLTYSWQGTYPLGTQEHRLGSTLEGSFGLGGGGQKLGVTVGIDARMPTLSTQQLPGGGSGSGIFLDTALRYPLTRDCSLAFAAGDVPLVLIQPGANYFAPLPSLDAHIQYVF